MEKPKKSRRKKLILWLLFDFAVAGIVIALLLYKPAQYHPLPPGNPADPNGGRVHPYLSHELMPTLYNGAQDRRPFEMVVLDERLNEALAQAGWLESSGTVTLSAPAIAFEPGRVVLMGTANIEGAPFVVTVALGPRMMEDGRLNLLVEKVKIGAMNITPLAKMMARRMYRERIETGAIDAGDWRTKIVASLLTEEPFEPVFPVEDKWVRLRSFEIDEGRLTARFAPAK